METKHTPTPWIMRKGYTGGFVVTTPDQGKNEDFITGTFGDEAYVSEQDAEFIVRACNAHEELVSLIEDLLKWDEAQKLNPYQLDVDQPTDVRARAIIAKARGEA